MPARRDLSASQAFAITFTMTASKNTLFENIGAVTFDHGTSKSSSKSVISQEHTAMALGENAWSAVTHTHAAAPGARRTTRGALLPWLSAALLVPAVMLLLAEKTPAGKKGELLAVQGRELAAGSWPDAAEWHTDAVDGLAQPVSRASKLAATHNVAVGMRMTELAEKAEEQVKSWAITPNDKVMVTMYMESECPACRKFSTLVVKEILDAPGVSDIVDFRPVPWGWGVILEAPTEQQIKANPNAVNVLNRTAQLLPILARLGAENATAPPMNFQCQHGPGECAGNALEACLVDVAPNHQQFFPVVDCVESRTCAEGMKPPLCVGKLSAHHVICPRASHLYAAGRGNTFRHVARAAARRTVRSPLGACAWT
jgi:hypothetical protein